MTKAAVVILTMFTGAAMLIACLWISALQIPVTEDANCPRANIYGGFSDKGGPTDEIAGTCAIVRAHGSYAEVTLGVLGLALGAAGVLIAVIPGPRPAPPAPTPYPR